MINIPSGWPAAALGAVVVAIAGFAGGYALRDTMAERDEAQLRAAWSAERETAARAAAQRIAAAQAAERTAATRLQSVQERLHETDARLRQALARVARADRMCLSSDTRRVLDDARRDADRVPARPAGPDPADAAAPADPGGPDGAASERAVAEWAATAIRLYGECRARIDAIRQWDEVTYGGR
ncbi:MAG TPA: hypothetical protein VNK67_05925 [Burkholderiales bacterium]|nr:hypothetical protein [Burkholderiales bacterium]